ncbi:MAG: bifunctional adenosylcobinamide kinase/adenosylcobinamide-phosphate guanylyltransferase [Candidatus Omnitrophota bacterium]|jgi:adenosylcobinamide kinase/adenosylcobinamide-phosphate guanylyltransferase|nr:bifunctional adenosylcobinamide kinase/adenosylcobinamide-phosphate guanylyltransferase [Candidatus Omnitrophota bacterium]
MGKIIFVLGGARSGKSTYAVEFAKGIQKSVAFVATCLALDEEMKKRIELHIKKRPAGWETFEEPKDVSALLERKGSQFDLIIIDCLTLLISNLISDGLMDEDIEDKINKMIKVLKLNKCESIIVSNEVGLGIVPDNELARRFRDLAGKLNQMIGAQADEVVFMVSGIPLKLKGGECE